MNDAALCVLGQVAPRVVALHGQRQVSHAHQPRGVAGRVAVIPRRPTARDYVEVAQPVVGVAARDRPADRLQPVEVVVGAGVAVRPVAETGQVAGRVLGCSGAGR